MEWVIEVSMKFNLLPETVFITIGIIDRFMMKESQEIVKTDLQCLAIAAMLIATKYEEIYPPSIKDMIKISADSSIEKPNVLKMESKILSVLEFDFTIPTCYRILERICKLSNADNYIHTHATYLLELAHIDG